MHGSVANSVDELTTGTILSGEIFKSRRLVHEIWEKKIQLLTL